MVVVSPILSLCVPVYNGALTLARTLESMASQIPEGDLVEIVLCDDGSTDNSRQVAEAFKNRYSFVHLFCNPKNLGMDGNFRQVALHARGKFVWFSGQDDVFGAGVVTKILSLIGVIENLGFIYINYSQLSHDMSRVLVRSFLYEEAIDKTRFREGEDIICRTPQEFFSLFPAAPTFLPATVIRRDFWLETDVSAYEGTAFNQTAVILLNMKRASMVVVTKPYIQGRIPDDQWQSNGQSLFEVFLGCIFMEALVYSDSRNPIPPQIYERQKWIFLKNFFSLARRTRHMGMKVNTVLLKRLTFIYGSGLIYWLYIWPAMRAPLSVLDGIRAFHRLFRNYLRRILWARLS